MMQKYLLVGCFLISMLGCTSGGSSGMSAAVANANKDVAVIKQFNRLFTGTKSFISFYTGTNGPPTWNSQAGIHGRYVLTMKMKITFDSSRRHIKKHEKPTFYLIEISKIKPLPGGRVVISNNPDNQRNFGLDKWKKLLKNKGDLSILGIKIVKDKPIKGFDKHWTGL